MLEQVRVVVPPTLREAARDCGMGARRGTVRTEPGRLVWSFLVPLVLFGLAILWYVFRNAIGAWYNSLPLTVLGVAPLVFAGWIVVRSRSQPQVWVGHYEQGIVRWVTGRVPEVYPWEEIVSVGRSRTTVGNGLTSASQNTLTVYVAGGGSMVLTDAYEGLADFAEAVDADFHRFRLPLDTARLEAGERLDFLLVRIDLAGIEHLDERLEWGAVEGVELARGKLVVRRVGVAEPWMALPAEGVLNLRIFLTLAEGLRRQHRPG
ncbi:DUF6585 family protein [Streptomyces sp. NPDC059247]|uniref:DUF6585 family protein n=1 Tax=Streptomyces sp. NPDC059247 TaxID=3346790 RepID=UPI00368FC3B1